MTRADSVHSTPPLRTSPLPPARPSVEATRRDILAQAAIVVAGAALMGAGLTLAMRPFQINTDPARRDVDEPAVRLPPRMLSSQERGDELLMRWRLERAAGIPPAERLDLEDRR